MLDEWDSSKESRWHEYTACTARSNHHRICGAFHQLLEAAVAPPRLLEIVSILRSASAYACWSWVLRTGYSEFLAARTIIVLYPFSQHAVAMLQAMQDIH